jgi:hypothetical protein
MKMYIEFSTDITFAIYRPLFMEIRNEYQESFLGGKGGRCVGLTALPPSCANCLKTWEPQPPGALRACNGIALPLWTYTAFIQLVCNSWGVCA